VLYRAGTQGIEGLEEAAAGRADLWVCLRALYFSDLVEGQAGVVWEVDGFALAVLAPGSAERR